MSNFTLVQKCPVGLNKAVNTTAKVQRNGRNPDIIPAYSPGTGMTLDTEACEEKSNEIKAVPLLLDRTDIAGKLVTADAMSMQKDIIDKIRAKGGYFLIGLKADQRALRYGAEDRIGQCAPRFSHTEGPEPGHGRIETRTYNVYDRTRTHRGQKQMGRQSHSGGVHFPLHKEINGCGDD